MGIRKNRWLIYLIPAIGIVLLAWLEQKRLGRAPQANPDLRARMRVEEYRSLREEINNILQRGYYIYFSTLTIALGLIGYGIHIDEVITSVCVILSPIPILHLGYLLILEQVRTVRRNASYIRAFHEGEETGIFWETRLCQLRTKREEEQKGKREVTVADILKGFPTVIDIMSAFCFIVALIRYTLPVTKRLYLPSPLSLISLIELLNRLPSDWWISTVIVALFLAFITAALAWYRKHKSATLKGAGKVESDYMKIWQEFKEGSFKAQTSTPPHEARLTIYRHPPTKE